MYQIINTAGLKLSKVYTVAVPCLHESISTNATGEMLRGLPFQRLGGLEVIDDISRDSDDEDCGEDETDDDYDDEENYRNI